MTTTERQTPDWLTEVQDRSWEPEILISGLTITVIFLLEKHIFNFHAALV